MVHILGPIHFQLRVNERYVKEPLMEQPQAGKRVRYVEAYSFSLVFRQFNIIMISWFYIEVCLVHTSFKLNHPSGYPASNVCSKMPSWLQITVSVYCGMVMKWIPGYGDMNGLSTVAIILTMNRNSLTRQRSPSPH